MQLNILNKFKETAVSVIPIMVIVLALGIAVHLDGLLLVRFVVGGILLIVGLTIFLLGVDLGIQPMGERCGAALTKKRSLPLLMAAAFLIGFLVTVAEPDIQVFGDQVKGVFPYLHKTAFVFIIGAGVGLFLMTGLLRTVTHFSLKIALLISYILVFTVAMFAPNEFIGIAFDSGGATTGPMTVPFILALGLGVSSVRSGDKDSFGLTGVTSVGPVLAVIVYSLILKHSGAMTDVSAAAETALATENTIKGGFLAQVMEPFALKFPATAKEASLSILPILFLFAVFQIFLLKMSRRQVSRMLIGFAYSFIGLSVFLTGVNGGFMQAGQALGIELGTRAFQHGGGWFALLIITGLTIGAIIVCAEPAVWVLSEQVESVSGGTIPRRTLLIFLAAGASVAIGLALWRAVSGFNLKIILIPGYILALALMIFTPHIFTGIAFDSGGVATGPLTSTFVLSFTLGATSGGTGNSDPFGVIALVAMMPLITIQVMGIIFRKKQQKQAGLESKPNKEEGAGK